MEPIISRIVSTRHPTLLFRIFHYPAVEAPQEGGAFGVGEHSDYGLLTLLAQDDKGGLEVRTRGGWIDALPIAGALVINVGDMLERLTRGRFRSAPHRVVNRSGVSRYSFPLFFDPDFTAPVEPLPIEGRVTGGNEPRWDDVDLHAAIGTYGDYLLGKVSKVFPELAGSKLGSRDLAARASVSGPAVGPGAVAGWTAPTKFRRPAKYPRARAMCCADRGRKSPRSAASANVATFLLRSCLSPSGFGRKTQDFRPAPAPRSRGFRSRGSEIQPASKAAGSLSKKLIASSMTPLSRT